MKKIINVLFFWFHLLLVPTWLVFSVIASPVLVLVVTVLHQAHLKLLKGCSLTQLQQKLGGLKRGKTFFDSVWEYVAGHSLTKVEHTIFKHALWGIPALSAMIRLVW